VRERTTIGRKCTALPLAMIASVTQPRNSYTMSSELYWQKEQTPIYE
jgi:hypothetical protein